MHRKQLFLLLGCIMSSSVGQKLARRGESERCGCLLERLGQEEALLHVVVRRVGGVDVLHAGEAPAHPAVLVDGLQGVTREADWGGGEQKVERRGGEKERGREINDKWTTKTKSNEMKRADTNYRRWVVGAGGWGGGGVWEAQIFKKLSKVCSN